MKRILIVLVVMFIGVSLYASSDEWISGREQGTYSRGSWMFNASHKERYRLEDVRNVVTYGGNKIESCVMFVIENPGLYKVGFYVSSSRKGIWSTWPSKRAEDFVVFEYSTACGQQLHSLLESIGKRIKHIV